MKDRDYSGLNVRTVRQEAGSAVAIAGEMSSLREVPSLYL